MINLKIYITIVLTLYLLSSNAKICFKTQVDNFDSGCEGPWSNTSCIISNGITHCDKSCRRTQISGVTKVKISCRGLRGYTGCKNKCKGDEGNRTCSGTKSYCDKYGCSLSNKCYCDLHIYDTQFQCDISGEWRDAEITYVMFSAKEYEFVMPQGNPTPWGVLSNRQRVHASRQARSSLFIKTNLQRDRRALASGLTISFETPRIIVGTQNPEWNNVLVSKDGISEMNACNTTRCEILLSSRFFINPGKVKVVVYLNDTFEAERSFNVGIQSRCDIPNCIFCAEMYYDFVCYPIMFKIFLISLLVASLLASIIMVGFIVKMILKYSLISCCIKSIRAANYKRKHKATIISSNNISCYWCCYSWNRFVVSSLLDKEDVYLH